MLKENVFGVGAALLVILLTLVEFAPIKINPACAALARAPIGRAVNADVLQQEAEEREG